MKVFFREQRNYRTKYGVVLAVGKGGVEQWEWESVCAT